MGAEILRTLMHATVATSIALALIGVLRRPLQAAAGARVAYWLWLLVPAMLAAVLLPAPPAFLLIRADLLPGQVGSAIAAVAPEHASSNRALLTNLALAIWGIGAAAMLLSVFTRHRLFARTLGALTREADGLYRAQVTAPMLVGAWHSKIIVPVDFEARYGAQERELILLHERAHASRHDVAVNALASFALCLQWFNPLAYRAAAWLRMDQELACDALVMAQRGPARRDYANALLKTQLATESACRQSAGCHWQSIHPLKERVAMLMRPRPARTRRFAGIAFITALTGVGAYVTWAGPAAGAAGPAILVDLKIRITNPQAHELNDMATQYLVHSGETIPATRNDGGPLQKTDKFVACTPYLADAPGRSTDWGALKARGTPIPTAGQILLACRIYRNGEIVQQPSVMADDGKPVVLETTEEDGSYRYRLEVTATSSPEKIAAAVKQSARQRSGAQK